MGDAETRQISFRCSQEVYDQIHRECERSRVSLKDFILQVAMQRLDAAKNIRRAGAGTARSEVKFMATPEEETMIGVLLEYVRNVPTKKFDLTLQTLALDAKYYRSARLKGSRFEGRFDVDDDAMLAKLKAPVNKRKRPTK